MPRIPLYNKGLGPTQELAAGQLSPRASVNAFTAPGRAFANYQKTFGDASKVAANFALAEREREDVAINSKVIADATEKLNVARLEASKVDTTIEEGNKSFEKASAGIIDDVKNSGYSKRREAMLVNNLNTLFLRSKLSFQENAFNNGNRIALNNYNNVYLKNLESLNGMNPSSPEWRIMTELMVSQNNIALQSGIRTNNTEGSIQSDINKIKRNNTRLSLSESIRDATSLEILEIIKKRVSQEVSNASDASVLNNLIDEQETEIKKNNIAFVSNFIDSSNIDDEFLTIQNLEDDFNKAKQGNFGEDSVRQQIWDKSSESEKKLIVNSMQANLNQAKSNFTFLQRQTELTIKKENDDLLADNLQKARNLEINFEEVNNLAFQGAEGEQFREQLATVIENRLVGAERTTDTFLANRAIVQKIQLGQITSITEKFIIPGIDKEPLSILERENIQLSSQRVDEFFDFFRSQNKEEITRRENKISDLIKSKELAVRGSSLLINKPTPASNVRMEVFEAAIRKDIREGLEDGKNFDDMLNILSPDYILPQQTLNKFIPSKEALTQEAKSLFDLETNIEGYTEDDVAPPTLQEMGLPANATRSQILNHPEYQAWENSFSGEVFRQLSQQ